MQTPFFFGYGSLVNRATHSYPGAQVATLTGWRRAWVRSKRRDDVVYLTAVPDPKARIAGLVAAVPGADWEALDQREAGYARRDATAVVAPVVASSVAVYAIDPVDMCDDGSHHILLSYLDVVVQGFLREFGPQGVADFFATTSGWDTPILDDRARPIYSRHQVLSAEERGLVDDHLHASAAQVQQRV